MSSGRDWDRLRRRQLPGYGKGKALEPREDDAVFEDRPREYRWTRPVALVALGLIIAVSVWLWIAGIGGLAILLFIVGGGSALLIAATARPS